MSGQPSRGSAGVRFRRPWALVLCGRAPTVRNVTTSSAPEAPCQAAPVDQGALDLAALRALAAHGTYAIRRALIDALDHLAKDGL